MQAPRLADTTGLSLRDATDAFNRYHRTHPEIEAWWHKTEMQARNTGVLYNLLGRRWVLTEIISEKTLESIIAFVPQSTVGDHVVRAMYLIEDDPSWPVDARIALNTHDGLVAIAPVETLTQCAQIMKRHLETPIYVPGMPELIIPAELKISKEPTSMCVMDSGKALFYKDQGGLHRWSELKELHL
jgi:DNA polymerase I-like protein with 3'-5' exonuclease and polymerase domains